MGDGRCRLGKAPPGRTHPTLPSVSRHSLRPPLSGHVAVAVAAAGLLLAGRPTPLPAQASQGHGPPAFSVSLLVNHASSWDLEQRTGAFINRSVTIPACEGIGIRVGYAAGPVVELVAEGHVTGYGDGSGYSVLRGGLEVRLPTSGRWVPYALATVGTMRESGGVGFTIGAAALGLRVRASRRLGVFAEVERSASLGGERGRDVSVSVRARQSRWSWGIRWGIGR